jgi:hypothetical protein
MELIHEEIEQYIEQISAGIKIVEVDDDTVLLKYPDSHMKLQARRVYDIEYARSLEEGLISTDDMKTLLEDRKVITDAERKELSSLKSKLEGQKILLGRTTKVRANQDRIKAVIYDLEMRIREIESKEKSKFSMTADTKAEEARILFLCWTCCYDFFTEQLQWTSYDEFLEESNFIFRQKVVSEFILFYSGLPHPTIRSIARSNLWRIRYVTSVKTSDPLFNRATSDYTSDMLNLAYWSHFYQNIYEMMPEDQPPEDIIVDDEALDAYLADYYEEKKRDSLTRRDRKRNRGSRISALNSDEVLVTRTNELYEDIKFDDPKEARSIKDRSDIRKKSRRSRR